MRFRIDWRQVAGLVLVMLIVLVLSDSQLMAAPRPLDDGEEWPWYLRWIRPLLEWLQRLFEYVLCIIRVGVIQSVLAMIGFDVQITNGGWEIIDTQVENGGTEGWFGGYLEDVTNYVTNGVRMCYGIYEVSARFVPWQLWSTLVSYYILVRATIFAIPMILSIGGMLFSKFIPGF